jgi:hypothetical protein
MKQKAFKISRKIGGRNPLLSLLFVRFFFNEENKLQGNIVPQIQEGEDKGSG